MARASGPASLAGRPRATGRGGECGRRPAAGGARSSRRSHAGWCGAASAASSTVSSSGRRGAAAVSCDADWSIAGEILITRPPHKVRRRIQGPGVERFAPPRAGRQAARGDRSGRVMRDYADIKLRTMCSAAQSQCACDRCCIASCNANRCRRSSDCCDSGGWRVEALERRPAALHVGRREGVPCRHERDDFKIRLGGTAVNACVVAAPAIAQMRSVSCAQATSTPEGRAARAVGAQRCSRRALTSPSTARHSSARWTRR